VMVSPLNNVFTFRNAHMCLQCMAYRARGGSNFSRQMTLAFRMQKPTEKRVRRVCCSQNSRYNIAIAMLLRVA
jgi:hypothetical protein